MSEFLVFVVIGLTSGAVYGLAGVGFVLTYKTSGVFNFGYGAIAAISAYLLYTLTVTHGVPWQAAAALCVVVLGPGLGLLLELLARGVVRASLGVQVASTVGVVVAVEAAVQLTYGTSVSRVVPQFLPMSTVSVAGVGITWSSIITFAIALVATAGLSVFLRVARLGIAMRAVVDDPDLLEISGTSATKTRRAAWIIGSTFAAASGVLFAPLLPLDPVQLTLLVAAAFGAGAIARFSSLPITFAGGLIIGVASSLATRYITLSGFSGVPAAMPFIVLFIVLLITPRRSLWTVARERVNKSALWTAPVPVQIMGGLVTLAFFLCVPAFAGFHLTDWTIALATTIVFLALSLLAKNSGQVSLCTITFTAIGAAAFSHLAAGYHIPWGIALLLAGIIAMPIGAVLAIPAIRQTGLYLALATFGFGIFVEYVFYGQSYFFGSSGNPIPMPRPDIPGLGGGDTAFYYLVLLLAVLATMFVIALSRTRLGRLMSVLADSPVAMASNGATSGVTRTLVFCITAALAAIGGALAGSALTTSSSDGYSPVLSLTYFAVIMVVPGRAPYNALAAGVALAVIPSYLPAATVTLILQLIFGVQAILLSFLPPNTNQTPSAVRRFLDDRFRRERPSQLARVHERARPRTESVSLSATDITVRFGGVSALSGVSVSAFTGKITGLIGPNGAGKTTMFNACTGFVSPSGGSVKLGDDDITQRGIPSRARRGIGRTFQRMELCDSLTVRENVLIGAEGVLAGANPWRHAIARRGEREQIRADADSAIELCGLVALSHRKIATLSTGQRRLVELARSMAGPYSILLLDEPSSGLDAAETTAFGRILRAAVAKRGVGILLIEHDMSLVLGVCDSIHVLDFGRHVFYGTPEQVASSPIVQEAYLGGAVVESELADEREEVET